MNPEFQRNLWLEISPVRLVWMVVVLALIVWLSVQIADGDNTAHALGELGQGLFLALVGGWGTFKAGRSVADEIRERTWDFQRLSALPPLSMTLGKLFGATAFCWFGGLMALALMVGADSLSGRVDEPVLNGLRLLLVGVLAHASALAASLAFARRGRGAGRVDAFGFMVAGIGGLVLGLSINELVSAANALDDAATAFPAAQADFGWWGLELPPAQLGLLLTLVLAVWAVGTAWRLMRVELAAAPNPWVYLGFLAVPVLVFAGFVPAEARYEFDGEVGGFTPQAAAALRLMLAYFIIHSIVFVMLFVEPKDIVGWRKVLVGGPRRAGAWPASATGLIVAAVAAGGAMVGRLAIGGDQALDQALVPIAAVCFLLRDALIVALFNLSARPARADVTALMTIVLLLVVGSGFAGLAAFGAGHAVGLFFVNPTAPAYLQAVSIASALVQALVVGLLVIGRWGERQGERERG